MWPNRYVPRARAILAVVAGCLTLLMASQGAFAQELSLLAGDLVDRPGPGGSYSWELEYYSGLTENLAACFCWINEGHVPGNHRDGPSVQIWARKNVLDRRLSLTAGVGVYRFFDTAVSADPRGFADVHGWGLVGSLGARWYTRGPLVYEARAQWVETVHNIDTVSFIAGVGYQLERAARPGPMIRPFPQAADGPRNEITLFTGQTISNSFQSQSGLGYALEYRRGIRRWLDWTASWLYEGDQRLIRRDGISSQAWLRRSFKSDSFSLGVGGGIYYSLDRYRRTQPGHDLPKSVAGVVTMTVAYTLSEHLVGRLSWNRIVSEYDSDADVIMLGLGFRFQAAGAAPHIAGLASPPPGSRPRSE